MPFRCLLFGPHVKKLDHMPSSHPLGLRVYMPRGGARGSVSEPKGRFEPGPAFSGAQGVSPAPSRPGAISFCE